MTEEGEGMEVVDEVEDVEAGDTQDLTVELASGSYVLICNIQETHMGHVHYQVGMRVAFTVE